LGLPTVQIAEISFSLAIFHLPHGFTMNSLPVQAIRKIPSQKQRTSPKILEISGQKNILKKFQKNSRKQSKFPEIAKKFSKVPLGENLQV